MSKKQKLSFATPLFKLLEKTGLRKFSDKLQKFDADKIKKTLEYYPAKRASWPMWFLISFCLTVEIFLHSKFGSRYLTWPKALVGVFFPMLCLLFVDCGLSFKIHFDPAAIGIVKPSVDMQDIKTNSIQVFHNIKNFSKSLPYVIPYLTGSTAGQAEIIASDSEANRMQAVRLFLIVLAVAFNFRLLEKFIRDRLNDQVQSRSSGTPYFIWDQFYKLGILLNFRSDLVKQYFEPMFCVILGMVGGFFIAQPSFGLSQYKFVCVWITLGGLLLFIKGYFENSVRNKIIINQIDSQLDSQAFEEREAYFSDNSERRKHYFSSATHN